MYGLLDLLTVLTRWTNAANLQYDGKAVQLILSVPVDARALGQPASRRDLEYLLINLRTMALAIEASLPADDPESHEAQPAGVMREWYWHLQMRSLLSRARELPDDLVLAGERWSEMLAWQAEWEQAIIRKDQPPI